MTHRILNLAATVVIGAAAPSGPIYIAHPRHQPLGAELYVESVVHWAQDAALVHGAGPFLFLALIDGESAFNDRALEPRTGAKSLLQLLPGSRWQRAVERDCKGATRSVSGDDGARVWWIRE